MLSNHAPDLLVNILRRTVVWVLLEELGTALIISFILLLVIAAVLLVFNSEDYADRFAEIAYYMLVGGVFIQMILVYKNRDAGDKNN